MAASREKVLYFEPQPSEQTAALKTVLVRMDTVDTGIGCYAYRTTHWLDAPLTRERFFEILYRSLSEAQRGYSTIQTRSSS